MTLSQLRLGEYFMLTKGSKAVYVRGPYDRSSKKYSVTRFDDMNAERFLKGTTTVTIEFEF